TVRAAECEVAGLPAPRPGGDRYQERQVAEDLLALGLCNLMSLPVLLRVARIPLEALKGLDQRRQPRHHVRIPWSYTSDKPRRRVAAVGLEGRPPLPNAQHQLRRAAPAAACCC